ncbi:MAG TPA: HEAT repeat domain-containing protein, partial [Polyangiaceae bacterium]|nr:HEAT repeat domain-containing protein [Polyangiaceae bacterium]
AAGAAGLVEGARGVERGEPVEPAPASAEMPAEPPTDPAGGPVLAAGEGILAIEAGETTVALASALFESELKTFPGLAVRRITAPPIPREEPDDEDEGKSSAQASTGTRIGRMARAPELRPMLGEAPSPFDQAWIDAGHEAQPDPEAHAGHGAQPDLDVYAGDGDPEAPVGDVVDDAHPPPSSVVVPPHRPPSSRTPANEELPSVIVDVQRELEAVVDKLLQGEMDELAEGELLRQGEQAVRVLISRFPGPITFQRARFATMANPPRASECGPLLRLIARERRVALPFVLERMSHPSPEVRGWATHLLGELAYPDALPSLLVALCDEDEATRASAAFAIGAIGKSFAQQVIDALEALATSPDPRKRAAALRAAGEVREPALVPELIRSLSDPDEMVIAAAREALIRTTRQDFGTEARRWQEWWSHNEGRDRLEWLIDALSHEFPDLRRASGEELRVLSRQYFGYASDLPLRDRERAQQRYRDWWITEGRAQRRWA